MRSIEWWHCRWPWVPPNRPKLHPFSVFCTAIHSVVTCEPRDFKFGTLTYHNKSHPADEKYSLIGAWSGSGEPFWNFTDRVISSQRLMLEPSDFYTGRPCEVLVLWWVSAPYVGVVRVRWAISTLWTLKIPQQQVVGMQVIYTIRPSSVCLWHLRQWEPTRSRNDWVHIVYHALPPTKSPTSYHRFGQDLSYKLFLHCCVAIGKISIDTTHRAVPRR